ncbi:L-serine ammonia-lyase, iron-sulfur-dependent, subunit alpha [bacterium]|nr:L-serine ammonia-lyase, iron-sulfur-dependent, subunit alpha [bacterium]
MNLLKEIISHEVFPAFGCTEPISVAYAAAVASKELSEAITKIRIVVDSGVYKNGKSVKVPNTGGERGNLIAGVIGAFLGKPELKMEILKSATPEIVGTAREFITRKNAEIDFDVNKKDLYIDVSMWSQSQCVRAVIEGSHTNVVLLERNGKSIQQTDSHKKKDISEPEYRRILRKMTLKDLVQLAESADENDLEYISQGIDMNLKMANEGLKLHRVGYNIAELMKGAYERNEIVATSQVLTASASDGRMAGLPFPVMSSGGAGNQGVVAILLPYNAGKIWKIEEKCILRSIVLSHLVNAYVKCFTGDLSVICGCAIAAGVGAAVAMVYQKCGSDMQKIGLAVNSVATDLGGIFCDGASEGCAMKVASSTDASVRAAYMAINGLGVAGIEGIAGLSPEKTIQNLSRITEQGMMNVNKIILEIMKDKEKVGKAEGKIG